jgi:hypothetical protein
MTNMTVSKNDAYLAWTEWGEAMRLEEVARIRAKHTSISVETAQAYISDFKALSQLIGELSEAGGSVQLKGSIGDYIRARFPFLERSGLDKALFLVDYYGWHDGYHTSPIRTVDLDEKPPVGPV